MRRRLTIHQAYFEMAPLKIVKLFNYLRWPLVWSYIQYSLISTRDKEGKLRTGYTL